MTLLAIQSNHCYDMPMKLVNLTVKNFRSIKTAEDVGEITKIFALIGRNNAGKSCFLKAIEVLFTERSLGEDDFHKDTHEAVEIGGTLQKTIGEDVENIELKIVYEKGAKVIYHVNGKPVSSKAAYTKNLPTLLSISDIRNPSETTTGGVKTTMLQKILKLQEIEDQEEFAKDFKALSDQIEDLKKRESESVSTRLTAKFNEVINERNFSISITPDVNLEKGIAYTTNISDQRIPNVKQVDILNSGTGLQSMFILSLLEVYGELSTGEDDAILIVEEPEVYLHPEYQRRMFAALRRIAETTQVIFTTHSPIMIADIWLTESVRQVRLNEDGETQIESVKVEDVIDELGIRYEDVLNPQLIVFIEGDDDEKFYKYLGLDSPKIKLIPTDGFRAIHYYAYIKIISSENVSSKYVLISDSDGEEIARRKESIKQKILTEFKSPPSGLEAELDSKILVLDKYAVESYFLNKETLVASFPDLQPNVIDSFLSEYNQEYALRLAEVKAGKLSLDKFQQYLKPKQIFGKHPHPKAEEAYKEFWKSRDIFLTVRPLIIAASETISKREDLFSYMLNKSKIKTNTELAEKIKLINNMLKP